ncbi:MAG TPA: 6,7-dimethyl-8-ribityllumazine synthase [Nitrososphaeraceae archaeon]|nr:6,7-dimethyl-8-ribityllumazine synthase [Nitrososphaeraceae archaeon]HSF50559.1 6,7-dimethyl-8-ribityllumazine synthase [Nitrososphaeraceae archaeon]
MFPIRIGIVVSEFNYDVTSNMLEEAKSQASKLGAIISYICYVPGTFDMPIMISSLLKKPNVDAIVTLGAVIKGDTKHDIIVAENTARLLADLSLKYKKPILLGISGPDMTLDQAWERVKIVPIRTVNAAVNMVTRLQKINEIDNLQNETIIIK